jgi:F-type H+-transporting ATPase subunit epsilon
MKLKVMSPSRIELTEEVTKVSAEGIAGSFTLLPRHVDYVASLVAGLLFFEDNYGKESFLAVDGGILVKCGEEVLVSTGNAVRGPLGELERIISDSFRRRSERERQAHAALEKIQADFVRQFIELQVRE